MKKRKNKTYCCVPDMILTLSNDKAFAMDLLSRIYDNRHKSNQAEKKIQRLFRRKPMSFKRFCKTELNIRVK